MQVEPGSRAGRLAVEQRFMSENTPLVGLFVTSSIWLHFAQWLAR